MHEVPGHRQAIGASTEGVVDLKLYFNCLGFRPQLDCLGLRGLRLGAWGLIWVDGWELFSVLSAVHNPTETRLGLGVFGSLGLGMPRSCALCTAIDNSSRASLGHEPQSFFPNRGPDDLGKPGA